MGAATGAVVASSSIAGIIGIVAFVIGLLAINEFIKIAGRKGYRLDGTDCASKGLLWAMGIFGTPVLAALYVIALPNLNAQGAFGGQ